MVLCKVDVNERFRTSATPLFSHFFFPPITTLVPSPPDKADTSSKEAPQPRRGAAYQGFVSKISAAGMAITFYGNVYVNVTCLSHTSTPLWPSPQDQL